MHCGLCLWDKKTNRLEYAGAYNSLYVVRNGIGKDKETLCALNENANIENDDFIEIKADKLPVAYEHGKIDKPFTQNVLLLKPGDLLYKGWGIWDF